MISDKLLTVLGRLKYMCEELAEAACDSSDGEDLFGASQSLDVITDIMESLMVASAIEHKAGLMKKIGVNDDGNFMRMFSNILDEESVN